MWAGSGCSDRPTSLQPPGLDYFQDAVDLLPKMDEEPTLEYAQVLCLFAYYSYALNRQNEAYRHIGLALRTCLVMGIHHSLVGKSTFPHSSTKSVATALERERVNRLWWTVYILNQLFSSKVGLPLGISDSDITAEPPGTIPLTEEEEAELYPCRTFVIDAELVKLRHEMTTSLYEYLKIHDVADDELTDPKGGPLVCKVLEYHSKLVYWEHNLPDDLKICIHRDGKVSGLTRRIATIYLCYYQVATVVLRPVLDLVFNQLLAKLSGQTGSHHGLEEADLCLPLSQQVQRVCEQTVADACNMMKVFTWLFEENMITPYNYWDCNHAFSSAVTILMAELMERIVNTSKIRPVPLFYINKEATRTSLDRATKLLEFQEELGSIPAMECMQLLRNLRLKVDGFLQVLQATQTATPSNSTREDGAAGFARVNSSQSSSPADRDHGPLVIQLADSPPRPNSFITSTSTVPTYDCDFNPSPLSSALIMNKDLNIGSNVQPFGNLSSDFTSSLWDSHVSHFEIWNDFEDPLVGE
ncbi:hypothetical protein H2204_007592 [Knufia peltigerae]|uniref:Xylanolytic transcriptional activator regulatory domain-containing protein n=1 Tax=Knufia peltigerae TaxID=1002370 RepID=A0AA38Y1I5_9EURO|nr:hypothetical protein H2204_007592 [Knufia peltigerae]